MGVTRIEDKVRVIESAEGPGCRFEVLEYQELTGSENVALAETLFYAKQAGIRLKMVRITINKAEVVTESGALYFMKGNIEMDSPAGGVTGLARKLVASRLTKEDTFKPHYRGTGEIYLEPTFSHFVLIELHGEEMVVDKGMFFACESTVEVGVKMQKNLSSALMGGEGFFQTKLSGKGIVLLASPVPSDEIIRYTLTGDKLSVDGNFAILRKGEIEFKVEKSAKSFFGSVTSGEGLLQTFRGHGEVWVAPTQAVYDRIAHGGLHSVTGSDSSDTTT
ncbi:MAG: AIM24 family protein [Planctomycetota bacterium]|nr:AIM24 family protein [Planctomycetota bacterium]MDA1140475.1 AIM24 family protein [Planctomycetota bacterium]